MEIVETPKALFETRELILILIPIAISFVITRFFRNKDKEDNDTRNLRAELREYFLTNIKPIIDEIIKANDQKLKSYIHSEDSNSTTIIKLKEYFKIQKVLIFELPRKFIPLLNFAVDISHKKYEKRFENYYYNISHILILYNKFIGPQILSLDSTLPKQLEDARNLIEKIDSLIACITFILTESELILFNYNFDNDKVIFQKYANDLNDFILDTGLDNAKDFLFDREKLEKTFKITT